MKLVLSLAELGGLNVFISRNIIIGIFMHKDILMFTSVLALGVLSCDEIDYQDIALSDSESEVVYGSDDRQDVYAHPDSNLRRLAEQSTVALTGLSTFDTSNANNYTIRSSSTLRSSYNLCSGQRFLDDPRAAFCSGTLVDDDLIITAGHCVESQSECESTQFVFNYYKTSENQLKTITSQDVFRCKKLEAYANGSTGSRLLDYAVIRLDRAATPRFTPAPVRTAQSPVTVGSEVAVLGFPTGIPLKIASGGFVTEANSNDLDYFGATVDTFGGNSGSGVYRMGTYDMVGILVRGQTDYKDRGSCTIVNTLAQNGSGDEDITYVAAAVADYCDGGSSARLCGDNPPPTATCFDNIQNQGETGVDCGGPCAACPTNNPAPTCSDNVQNQGETGVDCGGPCTACAGAPSNGNPNGYTPQNPGPGCNSSHYIRCGNRCFTADQAANESLCQ